MQLIAHTHDFPASKKTLAPHRKTHICTDTHSIIYIINLAHKHTQIHKERKKERERESEKERKRKHINSNNSTHTNTHTAFLPGA
jgi:hypothetical protein